MDLESALSKPPGSRAGCSCSEDVPAAARGLFLKQISVDMNAWLVSQSMQRVRRVFTLSNINRESGVEYPELSSVFKATVVTHDS